MHLDSASLSAILTNPFSQLIQFEKHVYYSPNNKLLFVMPKYVPAGSNVFVIPCRGPKPG